MKTKVLFLFLIFLSIFTSCSRSNEEKRFFILLKCIKPDEVWTSISVEEIDKINWSEQKYYLKGDSIDRFCTYALGSPFMQLVFVFDSSEIYRANLKSKIMAHKNPEDNPYIYIYI